MDSEVGATSLVLSKVLVQKRFSWTVHFAHSQRWESWWYSPGNELLNYLHLVTSIRAGGTGICAENRKRGASMFLCPQYELIHKILMPSGVFDNIQVTQLILLHRI
jgi:hypothetical protein